MPNRNILTISPHVLAWYEDEGGKVIVENFYNKREVIFYEEKISTLWKILIEESDYEKIKEKFCTSWNEKELRYCIRQLKRAGVIKIYYTKDDSNG